MSFMYHTFELQIQGSQQISKLENFTCEVCNKTLTYLQLLANKVKEPVWVTLKYSSLLPIPFSSPPTLQDFWYVAL